MRQQFHEQLDGLVDDLVRLTLMVETAMGRATTALLEANAELADQVARDIKAVSALHEAMDQRAFELVASQQPVAGDLRVVVAALRMTADLERMGALARHVADIARRYAPKRAVPEPLRETVKRMGVVAERITAITRRAIGARDWTAAGGLERADDEMDELLQALYHRMLQDSWRHETGTAIDLTLLGRYYERYADHAVSVARRVAFLTGHGSLDTVSRVGPRPGAT
jgi:phosphate transport system protein